MLRRINLNTESVEEIAHKSLASLKNTPRRTPHRPAATDKENLVSSGRVMKSSAKPTIKDKPSLKPAKPVKPKASPSKKQNKSKKSKVTTAPIEIDAEDLTSENVQSENYWRLEAERQGLALEQALAENRELHERVESLEKQIQTHKQMFEETRALVEVLQEMIDENRGEDENHLDDSGCGWVGR